jgi:4'-phosphopantetheinyl transferase
MSKISIFSFKLAENYAKLPSVVSFLDPVDLIQLTKISDEKRRQEFVVTRYVTKAILKDVYKIKNPKITYNTKGKPKIKGLKVNWTHSENEAVLAVSLDSEIGVDLEIGIKKKSIEKISKTYFHELEYQFIFSSVSEKVQSQRFKQLWALKESFVKALGRKLNKKTVQMYFDIQKKRILRLPTTKAATFFLHTKRPLAICLFTSNKAQIKSYKAHINSGKLKISPQNAERFLVLKD